MVALAILGICAALAGLLYTRIALDALYRAGAGQAFAYGCTIVLLCLHASSMMLPLADGQALLGAWLGDTLLLVSFFFTVVYGLIMCVGVGTLLVPRSLTQYVFTLTVQLSFLQSFLLVLYGGALLSVMVPTVPFSLVLFITLGISCLLLLFVPVVPPVAVVPTDAAVPPPPISSNPAAAALRKQHDAEIAAMHERFQAEVAMLMAARSRSHTSSS